MRIHPFPTPCAAALGLALAVMPARAQLFPETSTDYWGLVTLRGEAVPGQAGLMELRLTSKGRFSGKLRSRQRILNFKGRFGDDGTDSVDLMKRISDDSYGIPSFRDIGTMQLRLDPAHAAISGTIDYKSSFKGDSGEILDFVARPQAEGARKNPVPGHGEYLLTLTEQETGSEPALAVLTLKLNPKARVKVKGRMHDGRKVSLKTALCAHGGIPFYWAFKRSERVLQGWLLLDAASGPRLGGELDWSYWDKEAEPEPVVVLRTVAASATRVAP